MFPSNLEYEHLEGKTGPCLSLALRYYAIPGTRTRYVPGLLLLKLLLEVWEVARPSNHLQRTITLLQYKGVHAEQKICCFRRNCEYFFKLKKFGQKTKNTKRLRLFGKSPSTWIRKRGKKKRKFEKTATRRPGVNFGFFSTF